MDDTLMVTGEIWCWRGPAPHHFVTVPDDICAVLREASPRASYGWGMIPVACRLGPTSWTTSLWPKDGGYVVPLKAAVRTREGVSEGDTVTVGLVVQGLAAPAVDRDQLIRLVEGVRRGTAVDEEQEDGWLAAFAAAVPHPRAIDLVLHPEVEVGPEASAADVVDAALRFRR